MNFNSTPEFAHEQDKSDPLSSLKESFEFPQYPFYFCGNSLGLMPKTAPKQLQQIINEWKTLAVEGYFHGDRPWMNSVDDINSMMGKIVGAKKGEVALMTTLTANLHFLMISFFRPVGQKKKIVIEKGAFPSDLYLVKSQLRLHALSEDHDLIELSPRAGEKVLRTEDIQETISARKDEIALVLLGAVNYLSGQFFEIGPIAKLCRELSITLGLDCAHAAGNVPLKLNEWGVDFAAWCTYKYLNAGPGAPGFIYIHEKNHQRKDLPRLEGWWGNHPKTRFQMSAQFDPAPGVDAWLLSNSSPFSQAILRASLEIFDSVSMEKIRAKSIQLTGYLEFLLREEIGSEIGITTPENKQDRGAQLSLELKGIKEIKETEKGPKLLEQLKAQGIICDFRHPNILRCSPAPLYNSYSDVYFFVQSLKKIIKN